MNGYEEQLPQDQTASVSPDSTPVDRDDNSDTKTEIAAEPENAVDKDFADSDDNGTPITAETVTEAASTLPASAEAETPIAAPQNDQQLSQPDDGTSDQEKRDWYSYWKKLVQELREKLGADHQLALGAHDHMMAEVNSGKAIPDGQE